MPAASVPDDMFTHLSMCCCACHCGVVKVTELWLESASFLNDCGIVGQDMVALMV